MAITALLGDSTQQMVAEATAAAVAYDTNTRCFHVVVALARAEVMVHQVGETTNRLVDVLGGQVAFSHCLGSEVVCHELT